MKKLLCLVLSLFFLPHLLHGQNPGTGAYPFASFDKPGFDSINLGNLNTRFTIPIVNRQGRGQGFNYSLQYEGLIWINSNGVWVPDASWGFAGQLNGTGFSGYLSHTETRIKCPGPEGTHGLYDTKRTNFVYHDAFGGRHRFQYSDQDNICTGDDPIIIGNGNSGDGSGYTLVDEVTVKTRSGATIIPSSSPTGASFTSITDRNGNQVSGNGNGTYTDTLGVTALSVSGSNPVNFTYPVTEQTNGATTATASLSYQTYTVRTNFGCSGVVEYGSTSVSLPYRLTLADGSYYEFSYEGTYQATDGAVTGRLGSVRLPTGGTISYSYQYGCGAGINADGTVGSLTRVTSDGTRLYGRAPLNGNSTTTTLQDEKGNQTLISFTIDSTTSNFYETHRTVHQGDLSQAALFDVSTCYNGASAPCDSAAITLPISEVDTTASYNAGSQVLTKNHYDPNGTLLTEADVYSGSTLLTTAQTSYNDLGEVTSTIQKDGNGNAYTYSYYEYDQAAPIPTSGLPQHTSVGGTRGNLTASHVSASTTYLSTSTTYYDTGMPATSTAADGGITTYTYDSTGAFAQGTALPTPASGVALSTSASYDANSASLLSSTGMNSGETTSINVYDALLRPIDITTPSGSHIWSDQNVATPTHSMVYQTLDSGRTALSETLLDGYGRLSRVGQYNGASGNSWNQVDYCYDASGLLQFQSATYQSTGEKDTNGNDTPKHCSGAGTSYQYDALGRVTSVTTPDGTAMKQYLNRAVKTTDVNGVQKITQYDPLGRIGSVCEVSSATLAGVSPTDCGSDIAGGGFLTTYSYDLANNRTQVNQGGQIRTFATDAAGRTTSVTEPESGVTSYTYAYNNWGLVVSRTRPKANQSNSSITTTTTTQYDKLGRNVGVAYTNSDGSASNTPNTNFYYDVAPSNLGWSGTPSYTKGRLVTTSSGANAGSQYSYDVSGNVLILKQCAPSICGTANQEGRVPLQFGYDWTGALMSEYDASSGMISYTRAVDGKITSATNQTYTDPTNTPALVTNVVNGPFGPTHWHLGNGTSAVRLYDSMGRDMGGWLCSGNGGDANTIGCDNGTQIYGYYAPWKGSRVTNICDTVIQCQNNVYDDFGRLSATTDGTTNFTYTYDRWGNRSSQTGSPSVNYLVNSSNNQLIASGTAYDAAGNQGGDGIHSYQYDAEGRVVSVDYGSTAQYLYNAMGQRIQVRTASSTYEYLYDAFGRRVSSYLLTGSGVGNGNEGRIYWDYGLLANRAWNGGTYFHHTNWLGTERLRTDWQGSIANWQPSGAFGDGFNQSSSDTQGAAQDNNQFTGQEQDAESGTIHFQYRQYSSTQGRWMSPDPYAGSYQWKNPQSFNRYAYALNNPFSFTDPSGLTVGNDCGFGEGDCNEPCGQFTCIDGGGNDSGGSYDPCGDDPNCVTTTAGPDPGTGNPPPADTCLTYHSCEVNFPWDYGSGTTNGSGSTGGITASGNSQRLICSGTAYVLAGNPANVGKQGFPGVTVTNGSAAVIPRQFTGQLTGGPFMRKIGASTFGTVTGRNGITESFNLLTQAMGFAKLGTAQDVQDMIMARAPNQLVLEIVGGRDLGPGANVTINMPALGQGCPAGTSVPTPPHN